MAPKVSVIIPIYQVERYLAESLQSVRAQSLQEIEIICVDDGSRDACPAMLDRAAAEDDRICVIHNENHGYGYSVNTGFRYAKGEYLAILEPDDKLPERALEILYTLAVHHDLDLVKGDYCELRSGTDGSEQLVGARLHPSEALYDRVFCAQEEPAALVTQICVWGGVFRRKMVEQFDITLSETPGASFQDVSLFYPTMLRSKKILYTHQITYLYRKDNPGASTQNRGKLYFADQEYIKALNYLQNISKDTRLTSALWCARWRGALGTLGRIDPSLIDEFLNYLRPLFERAEQQGFLRREYCNAYQWAMLQRFLQSDRAFLRIFALTNGKVRNPARLWWRLCYDGVPATIGFLKQKAKMRDSVRKM